MMALDWAESIRETINYGKFINQFLPDIIKLIWQREKIAKKCRQKMSICLIKYVSMKKCCPNAHTHTHIYIHIYIYI